VEFPQDLRYTSEDEWVRVEDGDAAVGITDYAQDQLGDIVFVELPEVGQLFRRGDVFGVIESVKAASDLYLPIGGEVIAINGALEESPELVNSSPYGDGWLVRIRVDDAGEVDELMTADAYRAQLPETME
jgi:glycine cleavage system H protein